MFSQGKKLSKAFAEWRIQERNHLHVVALIIKDNHTALREEQKIIKGGSVSSDSNVMEAPFFL